MRKATILILTALAFGAFALSPVFACDKDKASASTGEVKAQMVGDKASCGAKAEGASAQLTGDKAACAAACKTMSAAECAAMCGSMSPEALGKHLGYNGKVQLVNMSVKGMTCGGCETSVKASLEKIDGVVKVCAISYKDNVALVAIDPAKVKSDVLTTTVTNKGYAAEIIPAVATTGTTTTDAHKGCTAEQKAACEAKKAAETKEASDKQPH
jgi:copper chaperone CopZ